MRPILLQSPKISLFVALPDGVFDIAHCFVSGALRFIYLAFALQFFVARHLASSILYRSLCLVGLSFDVFAVHLFLLRSSNLFEERKRASRRSCGQMSEADLNKAPCGPPKTALMDKAMRMGTRLNDFSEININRVLFSKAERAAKEGGWQSGKERQREGRNRRVRMRRIEIALLAATTLGIGATGAMTANATPFSVSRQLDSAVAQSGTVEKAAYVFAGRDYCFYPDGWHGPGFYWCGYSWRRGFGWGGPIGWHGWRAGGGETYAGHGHGYVGRSRMEGRMEGRMGGPNGRAEVRDGGMQHNSQLNGTGGRTLQNNAAGMGGHGLQNNARGMGGGSMGAGGKMSPHGGAMGAHGGPGAGPAGAPAAHGGGPGNQH